MRFINIMLALFVSFLIGLGVFEGGLRLTKFAPETTGNRFDDQLGWAKAPGAVVHRSSQEFDITMEINEHGLRDDPMESLDKPEGVYRVLCLGDSFTLGYTVDRQDLFLDQLENWWLSEGRKVEIINAGAEGYSTDQEVRWLEQNGADYAPDLVLIFPYENDIYWNGQLGYGRYPKPRYTADGRLEARKLEDPGPRSWTQNWATTKALNTLAVALRGGKSGPTWFMPAGSEIPMLKEHAVLLNDAPDFIAKGKELPLERTTGALAALKRQAAKLGAQLVVVPIPSHSDVSSDYRKSFGKNVLHVADDAWNPSLPVDHFLSSSKQLGIKTLDVRSTFRALASSGTNLYYKNDFHLNPAGNRALAELLHSELDSPSRSILPATMAATTAVDAPPAPGAAFPPFWLKLYLCLVLALSCMFKLTYKSESFPMIFPKVGGMLALVFTIFIGGQKLSMALPPQIAGMVILFVVLGIAGFLIFKLGRRLGTVIELIVAFILRGHWYLLPLLVVLLSIGSLLVVAASSPFVAPFIYTLF